MYTADNNELKNENNYDQCVNLKKTNINTTK